MKGQSKILGNQEPENLKDKLLRQAGEDRKIKRIIEGKKLESRNVSSGYIIHEGLEWEAEFYKDNSKVSFPMHPGLFFTESLERIKEAGFERHPRPAEFLGFLLDYWEGKFEENTILTQLAESARDLRGTWLSAAVELKLKHDNCYMFHTDPPNICYDPTKGGYYADGVLRHQGGMYFEVDEIPEKGEFETHMLSDRLMRYLYGIGFDKLPFRLQLGNVYLPVEPGKPHLLQYLETKIISCGTQFGYSIGVRRVKDENKKDEQSKDSHIWDFDINPEIRMPGISPG